MGAALAGKKLMGGNPLTDLETGIEFGAMKSCLVPRWIFLPGRAAPLGEESIY